MNLRKIVIDVIIGLLLIWGIFVRIDYIRLKEKYGLSIKPLITIYTKEYKNEDKEGIIYTGLGYSIHYYRRKTNSMGGYGVVYKLFNISLWGWEAT